MPCYFPLHGWKDLRDGFAKKPGKWVGIELDEPTGEIDGTFAGEKLFSCEEKYGLVLRNTQVKLYDPEAE